MTPTTRFYYVVAGAIADPPARHLWANEREVTQNPFGRPYAVGGQSLGANASDADLAALGVYRLHETERGDPPGLDYLPTTGALLVDSGTGTVQRVDGWREMTGEERAARLQTAWADQARNRKERSATRTLAEPLIDTPDSLRRHLAAALTLLELRT
jgi:hypothetical protein